MFESLGEPGSVATVWHQIGMVHRRDRQFEQAEQAYRQSLAIEVQLKNLAGEAGSLTELGILYNDMAPGRGGDLPSSGSGYYFKLQDLNVKGRPQQSRQYPHQAATL